MKKVPLLIALLFSLFCISSCKKIPVLPENKSKIIIGKQWKMTGYTENGVDKLTELYEPCDLDNFETYNADGTFKSNEGPTACDYDLIIDHGLWAINGNKLILALEDADMELISIEFEILELSAKTLKYALKDPDGPDIVIYTFTAQ